MPPLVSSSQTETAFKPPVAVRMAGLQELAWKGRSGGRGAQIRNPFHSPSRCSLLRGLARANEDTNHHRFIQGHKAYWLPTPSGRFTVRQAHNPYLSSQSCPARSDQKDNEGASYSQINLLPYHTSTSRPRPPPRAKDQHFHVTKKGILTPSFGFFLPRQ